MKRLLCVAACLFVLGAGCSSTRPAANSTADENREAVATSTGQAATSTAPNAAPATKPATKPRTSTTPLQPSQGTTKPGPTTVVVTIGDSGFSPQVVAVNAGDTVQWVNKGSVNHTVMSSASTLWNSGNILPGSSYSRKFPASGSYAYVDGAFPNLKGTVVVY